MFIEWRYRAAKIVLHNTLFLNMEGKHNGKDQINSGTERRKNSIDEKYVNLGKLGYTIGSTVETCKKAFC